MFFQDFKYFGVFYFGCYLNFGGGVDDVESCLEGSDYLGVCNGLGEFEGGVFEQLVGFVHPVISF